MMIHASKSHVTWNIWAWVIDMLKKLRKIFVMRFVILWKHVCRFYDCKTGNFSVIFLLNTTRHAGKRHKKVPIFIAVTAYCLSLYYFSFLKIFIMFTILTIIFYDIQLYHKNFYLFILFKNIFIFVDLFRRRSSYFEYKTIKIL
jgi:hypothetical protein